MYRFMTKYLSGVDLQQAVDVISSSLFIKFTRLHSAWSFFYRQSRGLPSTDRDPTLAMAVSAEHELLFALRSPTTPLDAKLELVQRAVVFAEQRSSHLDLVVRDWLVQLYQKSRNNKNVLLSSGWWNVLATTTASTPAASLGSTLPVFTAFVQAYTSSEPDVELVKNVQLSWTKLGPVAMRKATLDASLEALSTMLASTRHVLQRGADDVTAWSRFAASWFTLTASIVEANKGAKKVSMASLR